MLAAKIVWTRSISWYNARTAEGCLRRVREERWECHRAGQVPCRDARRPSERGCRMGTPPDIVAEVGNTFDADGELILPNMMSPSIANCWHDPRDAPRETGCHGRLGGTCPGPAGQGGDASQLRFRFQPNDPEPAPPPAIADLLPAAEVGELPRMRDTPLDRGRFGASFIRSRDRAIQVAIRGRAKVGTHSAGNSVRTLWPTVAQRAGASGNLRNPAARTKAHLNALSWLVRHAFDSRDEAYGLARIDDLFAVEIVERAVERYVERARAGETLLDPDKTSPVQRYSRTSRPWRCETAIRGCPVGHRRCQVRTCRQSPSP